MYSQRDYQSYATYQQPQYSYSSSRYQEPQRTYETSYTYNDSPRSRKSSYDRDGYTYGRTTAYSQHHDDERPSRQSRYAEQDTYTRRRNVSRPSDEYYRGRASPEDRGYRTQYTDEDEYDHSPSRSRRRSSAAHNFDDEEEDDEPEYRDQYQQPRRKQRYEDELYDQFMKGSKRTTYTYAQPEKPTHSTKKPKDKDGAKRSSSKPAAQSSTKPRSKSTSSKPKTSKPTTTKPTTTSSRPRKPSPSPQPQPQPPPQPTHRPATPADAKIYSIPSGYSLKNWDPTLRPLILLGSVFDANSLGKWIYDWTVFCAGPSSSFADMAAELWLGMLGLAGRCGRGEKFVAKHAEAVQARRRRSRSRSSRQRAADAEADADADADAELVSEFLEAGERLWTRLESILAECESWMYAAAASAPGSTGNVRTDARTGRKTVVAVGEEGGREFVASVFGRSRELESTERFMAGVRLWTGRFDKNCGGWVGR